jgi:hypothetical protein
MENIALSAEILKAYPTITPKGVRPPLVDGMRIPLDFSGAVEGMSVEEFRDLVVYEQDGIRLTMGTVLGFYASSTTVVQDPNSIEDRLLVVDDANKKTLDQIAREKGELQPVIEIKRAYASATAGYLDPAKGKEGAAEARKEIYEALGEETTQEPFIFLAPKKTDGLDLSQTENWTTHTKIIAEEVSA